MAAKRETGGSDAALPDGYAAALDELEGILESLEDERLDVDVLATKVERAAVLLAHCRARLDAAQVEVERVVATLDAEPEE